MRVCVGASVRAFVCVSVKAYVCVCGCACEFSFVRAYVCASVSACSCAYVRLLILEQYSTFFYLYQYFNNAIIIYKFLNILFLFIIQFFLCSHNFNYIYFLYNSII